MSMALDLNRCQEFVCYLTPTPTLSKLHVSYQLKIGIWNHHQFAKDSYMHDIKYLHSQPVDSTKGEKFHIHNCDPFIKSWNQQNL
jgi:hypothetical protein